MALDDLWKYQAEREAPKRAAAAPPARIPNASQLVDEPAKPSEGIAVEEFDGSTTVVQRIRAAIAKRWSGV
jgi:hypothetical protein